MLKPNTSNDYDKITDEVLSSFNLQKMQKRKEELLTLMKQATNTEELNRYQSELRELVQSNVRK